MEEKEEDCGCTEKRWLLARIIGGGVLGAIVGAAACHIAHGSVSLHYLVAAAGFAVGGVVVYRTRSS